MANQLKKFLVFMAMAMLVMGYAVSAARLLSELPIEISGTLDAGPIKGSGTTKPPLSGCLKVANGVLVCGSVGPPIEGSIEIPLANDQTGN
ncbi:hypothetical protein BVRB_5g101400 [Beta vulgaris subsp. vulgaris]|nr:hypothetical protein BVRB_5g101400 [Beta vulgaris subsp. vulgaris]